MNAAQQAGRAVVYRAAMQAVADSLDVDAAILHRALDVAGYDTIGTFGRIFDADPLRAEFEAAKAVSEQVAIDLAARGSSAEHLATLLGDPTLAAVTLPAGPPSAEEPAVDTVGYIEQIPAEPPPTEAAEQPAALPSRNLAAGVYPPDLAAPGYHVIEYTPRDGNGRAQAALGWDPDLGAWIAFPGGQYDPSVLKQSALAAEYVGALQYGTPEGIYSAVVLDPATSGERADGKSPALAAPYGSPPDPWASAVPAGWKVADRAIVSHNSRSVLVRTYGGAETPMSGIWTFFAPDEADTLARAITDAAKIVRTGSLDSADTLAGVGNAIRTAAAESELRAVFYRHFSLLFNASTADQALILAVFLERMLRLTEPQP